MKPETYKAAIYRGPRDIELAELPYPRCGDDDIIVKNLMATVCGSDVDAYTNGGDAHGIWKGHEFGHEMVSEVVEIGKNVEGVKLGDHVFPNFGNAKRDHNRSTTVGGFSEYIHIPQFEAEYSALTIPNEIPLEAATLLEPFAIGARGAKSLEPGPGLTATVFGADAVGLGAAIMLEWYGCDEVLVVDTSDKRLELAAQFGLHTCNPKYGTLKEEAVGIFGGTRGLAWEVSDCDLYIDAVGALSTLRNFQRIAKPFAKCAIVSFYNEHEKINLMMLCYMNWRISGRGTAPIEELFPDIIRMIRSGKYDIPKMVTHEYKLDDIEEAIEMANNTEKAMKVAIKYV